MSKKKKHANIRARRHIFLKQQPIGHEIGPPSLGSEQDSVVMSEFSGELMPDIRPDPSASTRTESLPTPVTRSSVTLSEAKTSAVGHPGSRRLKCPRLDCNYEGIFHREYELQRHIQATHSGTKSFRCPFPGCYDRTEPTAFTRSDKLTSHIRSTHGRDSGKLLNCCVGLCNQVSLPIDLLGVHIIHRHGMLMFEPPFIEDDKARGLVHAASTAYRQCPLWRCAKPLSLANLMQHLTTHTTGELDDEFEALRSDGYLVSEIANSPFVQVRVQCPVCHQTFIPHEDLQEHIDEEHLIAQGQQEHFRKWKKYSKDSQKLAHTCNFRPWKEWFTKRRWDVARCPCGVISFRTYMLDHHLSMMVDVEEIKPYRRAILKLYPDFATHPVWKDLA